MRVKDLNFIPIDGCIYDFYDKFRLVQSLNSMHGSVTITKGRTMSSKIAVATVSGKAYYLLVNELQQRRLLFLSCVPEKPIPPSVQVVITTEAEKSAVSHPNVLVYDPENEPVGIVDEAVRIIQSKEAYREVVVGVDPGKNFGVAVLGDGRILKKTQTFSLEKAVDTVLTETKRNLAQKHRVRIGNGIPELAEEIAARLDTALPDDVPIELVSEVGTSTVKTDGTRRKATDADSATEIARKNGQVKARRMDS